MALRLLRSNFPSGTRITGVCLAILCVTATAQAQEQSLDLSKIAPDLTVPVMSNEMPAAGRRVKVVLPASEKQVNEKLPTNLYFALYLPTDWKTDQKYPVIFEYPGNGPYRNPRGDVSSGRLEDCCLGYGASAGRGCIWVCLPILNAERTGHQLQWWGDADATARYCQQAVEHVCQQFGGDRSRLILAGFSRGAIACNYLGLRNDEVAKPWKGFIVHSHYDGVRRWPYVDSDPDSARTRLKRLAGRPQFISHEGSVDDVRKFVTDSGEKGDFTFVPLPFPNHTAEWVLRDIPARRELRAWLQRTLR